MSNTLICIPARYGSTRFPGKPLVSILGKPMLWHVWQACVNALNETQVVIATDHSDIASTMRSYGAKVVLTDPDLPNGTQRCFAAWQTLAKDHPNISYVINVQGDEPALDSEHLTRFIREGLALGTPIFTPRVAMENEPDMWLSPHVVKVVSDLQNRALYFSRSPIPAQTKRPHPSLWYRHLGIYGFHAEIIPTLLDVPATPLSESEQLEQLTWLEMGMSIGLVTLPPSGPAVDVPEDVEKVEKWLQMNLFNQ